MSTGSTPCGCCAPSAGTTAASPEAGSTAGTLPTGPVNRPGLTEVAYRIGTYGTFFEQLVALLPGSRELAGVPELTTRASDDPAIALFDAWACVADVLTFYQERYANEGYLRTATERRSLLELARMIGYELRPGVAASTFLVFQIEDRAPAAPGTPRKDEPLPGLTPPDSVTIPAGSRVLSVPAQNQLPQPYETASDFAARPGWNELLPRLTRPQRLATDGTNLYPAKDDGTPDTSASSISTIYLAGVATGVAVGDLLLFAGADPADAYLLQIVAAVATDGNLDRTRVDLSSPPTPPAAGSAPDRARAVERLATENDTKPAANARFAPASVALTGQNVSTWVVGQAWRERDLSAFLRIQGWREQDVIQYVKQMPGPAGAVQPYAFAARVGFFGGLAPRYAQLPTTGNPYSPDWDQHPPTIWEDSSHKAYTEASAYLERVIPEAQAQSWTVFTSPAAGEAVYRVTGVSEVVRADFALTGRVTGLTLTDPGGGGPTEYDSLTVRESTAYVGSAPLALADLPIEDDVAAGATALTLNTMVLGLEVGQAVALNGTRSDLGGVTADEVALLADIVHAGGLTTLEFTEPLQYSYVRDTLTISANVVPATNGATVAGEVLGGSDAATPNQAFTLKKPPLTYISAATATGAASTLEVRVDGLLWAEAPALYGHAADERVYEVRIDDDGTTRVIFGDGEQGARPASGAENIVATYRSGIGSAGVVDANQLTLMPTRPLGVQTVTNPLAATGAADPESRDDARQNAPRTVLTLERIVSVSDYEEFSGSFAGIGKALATVMWAGQTQFVYLTVATASGDPLSLTSATYTNLVAAIESAHDPAQRFRVDTYERLYFNLSATVGADPAYAAGTVAAAAEEAVLAAFGFDQRSFAQPVTAAELIATIQAVPGVVYVAIEQVYLVGGTAALTDPLEAQPARWASGTDQPGAHSLGDPIALAQLLLVNPVGVAITEQAP